MNASQVILCAILWWTISSVREVLAAGAAESSIPDVPDNTTRASDWVDDLSSLVESDTTEERGDRRVGSDPNATVVVEASKPTQGDIEYSEEFINCLYTVVEKEDYEILPNGSASVPKYRKLFNVTDYMLNASEGYIEVCSTALNTTEERQDRRVGSDVNGKVALEASKPTQGEIEYSEEFINCAHTVVEKENYEILPNGSASVPKYRKLFNLTDYVLNATGGYIAVCSTVLDNGYDDSKYSPILAKISIAGTAISAFCIVLHICMFLTFKKLRNLPGYSLVFLCISLLVAYTCMYATEAKDPEVDCTALGIIKSYAFLASFFWMNAMSYDIWRSLRMATSKLRLSGDRSMMTRLGMYSAYAWGSPLLITVIGLCMHGTGVDEEYKLLIETDTCWFTYRQALLMYFALPIFVLLGLNVLLFVSSFCMINSATLNTAENKADLWSRFLVSLRLAVVMGLIWIFGILAAATGSHVLTYLNVFCTVLQGVFIFFSFTFTEKMRKECRKAIQRRKTSSFPTQLSSTHQSTV